MKELSRYASLVGYSDHTDGITAAPAAVALGASIIEKHFTVDRNMRGPDQRFSADPKMFAAMVNAIRETEDMLGTGEIEPTEEERAMRVTARRSIVASGHLSAGTVLREDMIAYKRPGDGLMPYEQDKLLGKTLKRERQADDQIGLEDVE